MTKQPTNPTAIITTGVPPFNVAAVHLLVRQQQVVNGEATFTQGIRSSQHDLNNIQDCYITPGGQFFTATVNGHLAGFCALRYTTKTTLTLKRMATLPTFRRCGVGTALLLHAEQWAEAHRFSRIELSTGKNEFGRPLYEARGFTLTQDAGTDWHMQKHLLQEP